MTENEKRGADERVRLASAWPGNGDDDGRTGERAAGERLDGLTDGRTPEHGRSSHASHMASTPS